MTEWILILGMAVLTFLPRYIPFALAGKVNIPTWLSRALNFVPIAVLSSIIIQSTLIRNGELSFSLDNYHLIAAIAAFVTAVVSRHMFFSIGVGLTVFGLLTFL